MSSALPILELISYLGDTRPLAVTARDPLTGGLLNLTGITDAWFVAKESLDDADAAAVISRRLASGIAVDNAAAGAVTVTPTAGEWAALTSNLTYHAFLRVKTAAGKIVTVAAGYLEIPAAAPAAS